MGFHHLLFGRTTSNFSLVLFQTFPSTLLGRWDFIISSLAARPVTFPLSCSKLFQAPCWADGISSSPLWPHDQ